MATRNIRGRRIIDDSSSSGSDSNSEDELPDLRNISISKSQAAKSAPVGNISTTAHIQQEKLLPNKSTVRRRKLGSIADNPLLRPFSDNSSSTPLKQAETARKKKTTTPQRIELRTRITKPAPASLSDDEFSEAGSIHEETILEDFSGSDFAASQSSDEEDGDDSIQAFVQYSPTNAKTRKTSGESKRSSSPSDQLLAEAIEAKERDDTRAPSTGRDKDLKKQSTVDGRANPLSKLQLQPPRSKSPEDGGVQRSGTPPSPSGDFKPGGLASPSKKISRIPATPHHSHTDTFWNQEFIDEWNDEHSPKKQLFPPSAVSQSPSKRSSSPKKGQPSQATVLKAAKKAFEQAKHDLADEFLLELDERITNKEISELSAATGGIRIEWTNRLLTTAGRANWKRETIKTKTRDGEVASTRYRHHASIELSSRVIDDENRLLNVIAHEFCHLANFMISGVTTNPHGKEFKAWAAKVTRVFGDRDIEVTTRHSYDIDFKYVWECTTCLTKYKRHSKSINPERHRCGACKSELKQTKPVPRSNNGKESEYLKFMKEQMRVIKEENPGSQQKDIMKMVASRWAQREKTKSGEGDSTVSSQSSIVTKKKVEGVTKTMGELTVIDLT